MTDDTTHDKHWLIVTVPTDGRETVLHQLQCDSTSEREEIIETTDFGEEASCYRWPEEADDMGEPVRQKVASAIGDSTR